LKSQAAAYVSAKQTYDNHVALVRKTEADVAAITVARPNENHISENRVGLEKALTDLADKKSLFTSLDKVAVNYETTLENLATSKCPISDRLVCNTDKTVVKAELEGLLKDVDTQMTKLESQTEELVKEIAQRREKDTEYQEQIKEYQKKLLAAQRLEDLKKLNIEEPEEYDSAELTTLEAANTKLVADYQAAIAYETVLTAQSEVVELTKKRDMYDNILDQLSPKSGIKQILIEQTVQPLTEYMNEQIVKLLPGRTIHVDTEKGLEFMVADETDGIIGIDALSTSGKMRVALIIQDMLNELSGFRILMIDNIDAFDNDTLKAVFEYIADDTTLARYDSIFIAGLPNAQLARLVSDIGSTVNEIFM
jgi:DNA repair exonuclease SbcCD ATPase subunit